MKGGCSRSRANLNGGELDGENTSGTHKGSLEGRRFSARANLNGGELDIEPFLRNDGQLCERAIKEDVQMTVLRSRTVLNGGEREQEQVIGVREERGLQARAKINGGELDEEPILPEEEQPTVL